jgi:hypothetical protein
MSKNNVNPNHYKVAGRERQGEDIAQTRNKQKHAESLVRRRAEVGAGSQPLALRRGAASPGVAPARAAKTAVRKARATPLQTPPGQKRGHNLVPRSTVNPQGADKRGKGSTAQKRTFSRDDVGRLPTTGPRTHRHPGGV